MCYNIEGTNNVVKLEIRTVPETATFAKRNAVMPPSTQSGMVVMNAAILAKSPKKINHAAQAIPAQRDAQRVNAITPLFWA